MGQTAISCTDRKQASPEAKQDMMFALAWYCSKVLVAYKAQASSQQPWIGCKLFVRLPFPSRARHDHPGRVMKPHSDALLHTATIRSTSCTSLQPHG
jgi:hypothetical protein